MINSVLFTGLANGVQAKIKQNHQFATEALKISKTIWSNISSTKASSFAARSVVLLSKSLKKENDLSKSKVGSLTLVYVAETVMVILDSAEKSACP